MLYRLVYFFFNPVIRYEGRFIISGRSQSELRRLRNPENFLLRLNGTLSRFPDIKFIFSNAGGTIPILADRLSRLDRRPDCKRHIPDGVIAALKRLYYETALSANRPAMNALFGLVPPTQVLFGSDYPYAPEEAMLGTVKGLSALNLLAADLAAVERTNAIRLMPSIQANDSMEERLH